MCHASRKCWCTSPMTYVTKASTSLPLLGIIRTHWSEKISRPQSGMLRLFVSSNCSCRSLHSQAGVCCAGQLLFGAGNQHALWAGRACGVAVCSVPYRCLQKGMQLPEPPSTADSMPLLADSCWQGKQHGD